MDGLSTVVLLALLSLGSASPLSTVTQIPRMDEDMFREVATDGFIVNQQLLTSLTTQAPHNQTATQQRTTTEREEEGSAMGESPEEPMTSTTQVGTTQDDTTQDDTTQDDTTQAGIIQDDTTQAGIIQDDTTQAGIIQDDTTQAGIIQATSGPFTSTPALPVQSSTVMATSDSTSLSKSEDRTTMEPSEDEAPEETTTADLLITMSDWGSGQEENTSDMLSHLDGSRGTEEPISSTTIIEEVIEVMGKGRMMDLGHVAASLEQPTNRPETGHLHHIVTEKPSAHVTPEWIIIVGFLVGLAALVLLCVAIATREKWNGPHQFNQTGATLTPANQQREVEMEKFLHEEHPKEIGKAEEYTVIPLDELPDSYSS